MSTSKGAEAKIGLAKAAETKSVGKLTINENREASRPRINAAFAASLNRLEQHYKAVISLATIQILVAILGIAWQCHAGFYTVGVNSGYNTFWVAGPMLFLTSVGLINKKKKRLVYKDIILQEVLAVICMLCLIGGCVFIVIAFDNFIVRPKEVFNDRECHIQDTPFRFSGFVLVNLIVTTILLAFYVYYSYVCKLTRDSYVFQRKAISPSNNGVVQV